MDDNNADTISYLALGDSYTIGTEIAFSENYPSQIAQALKDSLNAEVDLKVIAQNAWRADDLKRAIKRATLKDQYDLVTLLIGVNNQYQGWDVKDFKPEFLDLLDTAIQFANGNKSKVSVFSIPNYGVTPFGAEKREQITSELQVYNQAIDSMCQLIGVDFYDVFEVSLEAEKNPDFVAKDGLHPTKQQYAKWVEPYLKAIIQKAK